jgi:rhodanese-related sulfurtransferase
MKTITPTELQQHLSNQADLAVLDVRTPAEFSAVHVPQARNFPLDTLDPQALLAAGAIRAGQPVYLLCQGGGRATRAAEKFVQQGLEQAVVVEGGTNAWIAAKLPVTRGAGAISLERQVRIGAGALVLAGVILGVLVHPYFIGLSAFVGAGLVFAGITDWCGMGLLLAKAPWNQRPVP